MKVLFSKSALTLLLALTFGGAQVHAACRYPLADGGESDPTAPNVVGIVTKIEATRITLHSKVGSVDIGVPASGTYYTAFGGDGKIEQLNAGLVARAWYVGCKTPRRGAIPKVAYLEVYSNDPKDRPPKRYWKQY